MAVCELVLCPEARAAKSVATNAKAPECFIILELRWMLCGGFQGQLVAVTRMSDGDDQVERVCSKACVMSGSCDSERLTTIGFAG